MSVKIQLFGDLSPFKDSSPGIQFFSMTRLPSTHKLETICGFVSALENVNDPEYHWTDTFRTPRTSNESRTRTMYHLSGELRRIIGK